MTEDQWESQVTLRSHALRPAEERITAFLRPQERLAADVSVTIARSPGKATARPRRTYSRRPGPAALLVGILILQSVLSLRLVRANTAFTDEALYLWAGRLEISHWLHGTPVPAFPTYFSGAPVIYPPIGALANSIGGLAGARILSLVFMLGATCVLWATAGRIFSTRAQFFATALWATLASTQFLGAFATYDAPSLLLMAIAAWCVVHAGPERIRAGWLTGAAVALASANATKYASAAFDPVVCGLLVCTAMPKLTARQALGRAATLAAYVAGILGFLCALGGGEYVSGVMATTLARPTGNSPAGQVVSETWHLTAVVVVLALLGAALGLRFAKNRAQRLTLWLLALSAMLVPLEQARIHTTFALQKHVDFGAWFCAIAAGYAIELVIRLSRSHAGRAAITFTCAAALVLPVRAGAEQATSRFHDWPNAESLVAALRSILPTTPGPVLVGTPTIPEYYLPSEGVQWWRWSNLYTLRLPSGRVLTSGVIGRDGSIAEYQEKIRQGYFSVVVINLQGSQAAFNAKLLPVVQSSGRYRLAATTSYWRSEIWVGRNRKITRYTGLAEPVPPLQGLLAPAARLNSVLGSISGVVVGSGAAVAILTLIIRLFWRRGKASGEV